MKGGGKCGYCSEHFSPMVITEHLKSCDLRKKNSPYLKRDQCSFLIRINDIYTADYWVFIEVAGITSCFIATFVTLASSKDIRLSNLNVKARCNINFAKTFDVADEPITEGIEFHIEAESSDVGKQQLQEVIRLAEEKSGNILYEA